MTKKAKEYLDGWKRCKADFLNFKKEIEKKQKNWEDNAKSEVILQILPVLDGLELLTKELKRCLNIQEIKAKKFNPEIHEAIAGRGENIVEVVQKGYILNEARGSHKLNKKLIRPAKVKLEREK